MNFSDILLTVDFDRTLTARDSSIPQRNIEAIRWFIERGGSFTVNTGRSVNTFRQYFDVIPANVPLLLYNGSAAYENGKLTLLRPIELDVWQTMEEVARRFPEMHLEIQSPETHYLIRAGEDMEALYRNMGWQYRRAAKGDSVGPFIKFSLWGKAHRPAVADMFEGTQEELRLFDEAEAELLNMYGDRVSVFRAAPRIIDVHRKGVSKLTAARDLQKVLGKKILVCVGDAENDITMLDGADYAFCPAESVVSRQYETVCNCDEGAVADVIYKKIPEILANKA